RRTSSTPSRSRRASRGSSRHEAFRTMRPAADAKAASASGRGWGPASRESACGSSEAPEGSAAEPRRRARASGGGAPRAVITGVVVETLPRALYRVRLDEGPQVLAHIADRIDRNFVRV